VACLCIVSLISIYTSPLTQHGFATLAGWQLPENNHPIQDTAHGLRLEPLIKSQNQNLELVPDLMTDSGATAVERVPRPERHGSVYWIGNNIRGYA